ncbi:MAG TPA: glycosyltransferase, partial [Vicinamibacterales bacterium]|nr:glycosyltransferase [Vicinamibacterales bacterium]
VCVVPLRIARGIQNKLLEAMSFGCAVVATPAAACALGPLSDEELLVREAPADFADAVSTLIENPVVRTNLGRRARLFVEQRCQWDRSLDRLTALIESTIH